MKALLTGATGFVGSHLAELLVRQGHSLAILRRESTRPWRIESILPQVKTILGDLENVAAAAEQISRFAPDSVLHCGWQGVARAARDDVHQIARNRESIAALVQVAAEAGCPCVVGLGSQAEYGPLNRIADEATAACPTTAYGAAKLGAYQTARHLARQAGIRFAWIRIFSLYGPRDNEECMIPSVARALLRREKPGLTAGEQLWDYLYIGDAVEAISRVAQTRGAEGIFNLGSGEAQPIRRVVEILRDLIDPALPLEFGAVPYRADQIMYLQADISRLKTVTGWRPRVGLSEGLARTVEWCRCHGAGQPSLPSGSVRTRAGAERKDVPHGRNAKADQRRDALLQRRGQRPGMS